MSAFIVEDKTINRVLSYLSLSRDTGEWYRRKLAPFGWDGSEKGIQKTGQAMMTLNVRAVDQRYDEENARPLYRFHRELSVGPFQALKSLKCWLYQCSEGNVPEESLFKLMEEYSNSLAYDIASSFPEYEKAAWG